MHFTNFEGERSTEIEDQRLGGTVPPLAGPEIFPGPAVLDAPGLGETVTPGVTVPGGGLGLGAVAPA
ncbi:MAG: hypothetical protein HY548_03915, partial [Elusimicrobia bacterium]|nr:hypothetical protein [Elusimicrobiota bacterium]